MTRYDLMNCSMPGYDMRGCMAEGYVIEGYVTEGYGRTGYDITFCDIRCVTIQVALAFKEHRPQLLKER